MTILLEKAFAEASKLSEDAQDALGALLLEELASEQRWSEAFAHSQHELEMLADEALAEFEQGKTEHLDEEHDLSHN
jgi:hypothetical protein